MKILIGILVFSIFAFMKSKILYIVNPISGTQQKLGIVELIQKNTDTGRYDLEIAYTQYAGHASDLAAEAVKRHIHVVVAVGGDGTVNEVARSLVHTDTILGIIPCGSGNGLARHLGIPLQVEKAIDVINRMHVHTLDYGVINDRPFFCTCGVGFDAFISEKFARSNRRGLLTYVENTLRSGLSYKPRTYLIEDENGAATYKAFLIACANASQYGNDAYIAPHASMQDGLFDVVVMKPFKPIEAPQVALQMFNKTLPDNSHVRMFKTSKLKIYCEGENIAHYDGDPFRTGSTIEISIVKQSFKVIVNSEKFEKDDEVSNYNLFQSFPTFLNDWKKMPEALISKTSQDIKRLNKNILDKLKNHL